MVRSMEPNSPVYNQRLHLLRLFTGTVSFSIRLVEDGEALQRPNRFQHHQNTCLVRRVPRLNLLSWISTQSLLCPVHHQNCRRQQATTKLSQRLVHGPDLRRCRDARVLQSHLRVPLLHFLNHRWCNGAVRVGREQ